MNEEYLPGCYGKPSSALFHRHFFFVALLAILIASSSVSSASEVLIDLGGPRKAIAKLLSDGGKKSCEISFIGVQAFDKPTNELLNQSKSKFYAIQAFAKDHKIAPSKRFSCAVRRIAPIKSEGNRVTSSYQLDSISLSEDENAATRKGSPNSPSQNSSGDQVPDDLQPVHNETCNNLLTAMSEMTSTLMVLVTSLQEQIDTIRNTSGIQALDQEVAELESRIQETVQSFDAAVSSERMLLESEKDQLKTSSKEQSKQLISALASRYEVLIKAEPSKPTPKP